MTLLMSGGLTIVNLPQEKLSSSITFVEERNVSSMI